MTAQNALVLCNDCQKVCTLPDPAVRDSIASISRTGYQLSTPKAIVDAKIADMHAQVAEYEEEMQLLDAQRARLEQAKTDVEFSIAAYHSVMSPIRRLPVEILLVIFQMACAVVEDILFPRTPQHITDIYFTPFYISAVCAYWRSVMIPACGMWRSFSHASVPHLRLFGGSQYTYRLRTMFSKPPEFHRKLLISIPNNDVEDLPLIDLLSDSFKTVTSVAFFREEPGLFGNDLKTVSLEHLPVQHLALSGVPASNYISLDRTHLRTLWLENYSQLVQVVEFLTKFPWRLELTLHRCSFLFGVQPRMFCKITALHISHWRHENTIAVIFGSFTFPHLQSLALTSSNEIDVCEVDIDVLRQGLEQCPLLVELKLKDIAFSNVDMVDVLYMLDRLTSLSIIESYYVFPWNPTLATALLEELRIGKDLLVPQLTSIELVWSVEWGIDEDVLMDMLEARSDKLTSVVIGGRMGMEVGDSTVKRLKKLRDMGVQASLW